MSYVNDNALVIGKRESQLSQENKAKCQHLRSINI